MDPSCHPLKRLRPGWPVHLAAALAGVRPDSCQPAKRGHRWRALSPERAPNWGKRYLPSWLDLAGVLLTLYGLVTSRIVPHIVPAQTPGRPPTLPSWTSTDVVGILALFIGIGVPIAWFAFSSQVMEFKVSGAPHFTFGFSTVGSSWNDVRHFISEYSEAKRNADRDAACHLADSRNGGSQG